jgi:hypothetical protein
MRQHAEDFVGAAFDTREGAGDGSRWWYINTWALSWSRERGEKWGFHNFSPLFPLQGKILSQNTCFPHSAKRVKSGSEHMYSGPPSVHPSVHPIGEEPSSALKSQMPAQEWKVTVAMMITVRVNIGKPGSWKTAVAVLRNQTGNQIMRLNRKDQSLPPTPPPPHAYAASPAQAQAR